jgi:hypothetical protein
MACMEINTIVFDYLIHLNYLDRSNSGSTSAGIPASTDVNTASPLIGHDTTNIDAQTTGTSTSQGISTIQTTSLLIGHHI